MRFFEIVFATCAFFCIAPEVHCHFISILWLYVRVMFLITKELIIVFFLLYIWRTTIIFAPLTGIRINDTFGENCEFITINWGKPINPTGRLSGWWMSWSLSTLSHLQSEVLLVVNDHRWQFCHQLKWQGDVKGISTGSRSISAFEQWQGCKNEPYRLLTAATRFPCMFQINWDKLGKSR